MSGRQQRAATKKDISSKFAELRALKQSGKRRIDTYAEALDDDIYEEVDEESYKQVVRDRLDRDDFVVDDNGLGYADNGVDEWDNRAEYSSEDDQRTRKVNRKKSNGIQKGDKPAEAGTINKFVSKASVTPVVKTTTPQEDNDFVAGLLGEVNAGTVNSISRRPRDAKVNVLESTVSRKRASSPPIRNGSHKRNSSILRDSFSLHEQPELLLDAVPDEEMPLAPSSPLPVVGVKKGLVTDEEDEDEEFLVKAPIAYKGDALKVNLSSNRPQPRSISKTERLPSPPIVLPSSDGIDATSWMNVHQTLKVAQANTTAFSKVDGSQLTTETGSVLFYWTDYVEVNGVLGLFGKVFDQQAKRYVSTYCRVDGIMRNLYFLPRDHRKSIPDEEVTLAGVHTEVSKLMAQNKIGEFRAKTSERKYAFELPDIPQESDYLKVLYSYKNAQFPDNLEGDTFSHVFGTNTAMFEQFVLYRRIMGPCWLELKSPDLKAALNTTWCRLELGVSDPELISVVTDLHEFSLPEVPPLTLVSVAFRTVLNAKENKSEIVVASARIYPEVNIEDPTPAEKIPSQVLTIVRPLRNVFPNGFELEAKRQNIVLERSEAALLNAFMAKLQNIDPDVIVGHDWESSHFGTLLARLREKKISNWHRIGRLKRGDWPKFHGRGSFYVERSIAVGRLMCDLSNDLGRSLIQKAQSWSLTELCKLELGVNRKEIDSEKALQSWTETARGLLDFVMHCATDTYYQAAIAIKVQILPLSRQLTVLAGNSWAATLSGTRAQRNEYILLHEFTKNKYICPDKTWQKQKVAVLDEEEDEGLNKKKDKFKGGLVFEPEKGLYDNFILVMDFNSLYPSIIQEYNICFTTIERQDLADTSEDVVPDLPPRELPQGVLPKIIANLVNRRRQVKSLMKDKNATAVQRAQWDIRQQALKLTANSMYGCLGYTKSRFYARPLAILTTFKGREALTQTKELAESQDLRVIYGDTDSVMINTNVDNYRDAIRIGHEFKRNVNERYKLLEIDIDNVFQRLLLHAKKKYAALVLADVNGKLESKIEVKGLDMRRREYCTLSKEASQFCLDKILSGEQTDIVVEQIHEYLRQFSEQMRNGQFPIHKYIILNRLGKEPEAYPNAKTMPHVQVALKRKAKGDNIKAGDVMQYIITGEPGDTRHVADRAYPASDVTKSGSELVVDYNYYLANQILPPLERLCAPIDGTDRTRIAECLGLDPNKYRIYETHEAATTQITPLEASISDEDRFADAQPLHLACATCKTSYDFRGLRYDHAMMVAGGIRCLCEAVQRPISINAQLQAQIHALITKYYQGWLICDDSQCQTRTQQCGVYGKRCLSGTCRGEMSYELDDKKVYNQLLYYDSIFNVDKVKEDATLMGEDRIKALIEQNRIAFERSRLLIGSYLKKCGRRYVDMSSIFSFCLT